jgi:D-alanine-D-alanine ligase
MAARPGFRVVVLHNADFSDDLPGAAARADVENAARAVADGLAARGHRAEVMGVDYLDLAEVTDELFSSPPDVVFNLCESLRADARHEIVVPALLDLLGVPYTGSGPITLGLALRKDRAKVILKARGVPTPEAVVMTSPSDECRLPFPLIVKPTREDASVGITSSSVVREPSALQAAVGKVVEELHQPALVERFIEGREMYVSLLGNDPPEALPLHEIDFTEMPADLPRIVSYRGKWEVGCAEYAGSKPGRCDLSEAVRNRVVRAAREAFEALEVRDYGRVDVRLAADNTPYVIDVNPNCDLTESAGFSRASGYGGIEYPKLVERVCLIALERHRHVDRNRAAPAESAAAAVDRARAASPAAPRGRSTAARGADHEGRAVPGRRGGVRARADRRRALKPPR